MIATDKLVSIIIPCYNQARFLAEAIESALQQDYPHFEVIVVDDGSTDHTSDVARSYPRVVTLRQHNQGASAARNNGVLASSGRYLVFLDSDDRLLPHALRVGVRQLLDHPDCAFVYGHRRDIATDGTALSTNSFIGTEKDAYRQLLLHCCVYPPCTAMFRRDLFERVGGFDPRIVGAEDYELFLRIARQFPIFGYDEIVVEYRRHVTSMSDDSAQMLRACLEVLHKQRRSLRGNREWEEACQTGMNNWRRYWGERLVGQVWVRFKEGRDWQRSLRDMMVLMRHSPDVLPRQVVRRLFRPLIGTRNHRVLED